MFKLTIFTWCLLFSCCPVYICDKMLPFGNGTNLEKIHMTHRSRVEKEIVLNKILRKLNLSTTPRVVRRDRPRKSAVTRVLENLIKTEESATPEQAYSEITRVVLFAEKGGKYDKEEVVTFKITDSVKSEGVHLKSVVMHLTVFVKPKCRKMSSKRWRLRSTIMVRISSVTDNETLAIVTKGNLSKTQQLLDVSLPLKSVDDALNLNDGVMALRIQCIGCSHRIQLALVSNNAKRPRKRCGRKTKFLRFRKSKRKAGRRKRKKCTSCDVHKYQPMLILRVDRILKRPRRRRSSCMASTSCCKTDLHIDFSEIGWDNWVVFPTGFITASCEGHCGNDDTTSNSSITTSCQQTNFTTLQMVYMDSTGALIESRLSRLVARDCACQVTEAEAIES